MRDQRARRGKVVPAAVALGVLLGGGLSACGGEDPFSHEEIEDPIRGGLNNEDVLADPAVVVEGLGVIKGLVNDVMNKLGSEDAEFDNEAILPVWEDVEGRIKADDPTAHQLLEAQFLALTTAVENKDKMAGRAVGNAILQAIDTYLATPHTASPSPSPSTSISPSPSSTAIPSVPAAPSSTSTPSSGATPASTATSSPSATAGPTS